MIDFMNRNVCIIATVIVEEETVLPYHSKSQVRIEGLDFVVIQLDICRNSICNKNSTSSSTFIECCTRIKQYFLFLFFDV